ncbi:MAG: hypothetical protein AAGA30_12005, partial [Planctomycetota bacterium]
QNSLRSKTLDVIASSVGVSGILVGEPSSSNPGGGYRSQQDCRLNSIDKQFAIYRIEDQPST